MALDLALVQHHAHVNVEDARLVRLQGLRLRAALVVDAAAAATAAVVVGERGCLGDAAADDAAVRVARVAAVVRRR